MVTGEETAFLFGEEEVADCFEISCCFFLVDLGGDFFEEGVEVNLCSISNPKNVVLGGRRGRLGFVVGGWFKRGLGEGFLERGVRKENKDKRQKIKETSFVFVLTFLICSRGLFFRFLPTETFSCFFNIISSFSEEGDMHDPATTLEGATTREGGTTRGGLFSGEEFRKKTQLTGGVSVMHDQKKKKRGEVGRDDVSELITGYRMLKCVLVVNNRGFSIPNLLFLAWFFFIYGTH